MRTPGGRGGGERKGTLAIIQTHMASDGPRLVKVLLGDSLLSAVGALQ